MNLSRAPLPVFALALLAVLACCTKSDPFGKELFDDPSGLTYTDTLTLKTSIVREDSTATGLATTQLLGLFIDPVFGKTEAVINTNFWPGQLGHVFPAGAVCDSAVIYLHYAVDRFYGDTTQPQGIEVYRTDNSISTDSTYFSGATATASTQIGGLLGFNPKPRTKREQRDSSGITAEVDTFGAYVRIPVDAAFGQEIINIDTADSKSTKKFTEKMRGLQFRAITPSGCMMAFNLNRTSYSRITVFFHQKDSVKTETFHCFFTANKWTNLKHDYAGTVFENKIGQPTTDNLFVQAGAGLKVKIDLPTLANLTNRIAVNQAELELTVLSPPLSGDNKDLYPWPTQFLLSKYVAADEKFLFTDDVYASAGSGLTGSFAFFGGSPKQEEPGIYRYRLNLSDHLQDMVLGKEPATIYLNVFPQNLSVTRGVLVGTGGPAGMRAKLNLKYSKFE